MGWEVEYRCEATSVAGFVQQLAVSYLKNRYWFYVLGEVPPDKDPRAVDEKLVDKYEIALSKWAKARRMRRGEAKLQYLRYARSFVLVATHGSHPFFEEERPNIRDARERPIPFAGYSISYRDGHPHVRIGLGEFKALLREFEGLALSLSAEELAERFRRVRYEPYGPVKLQLRKLLGKVNQARRTAGLQRVPEGCLRLTRRSVRTFA